MSPIQVRTAPPEDLRKVLRLTLATGLQSEAELERQVTGFIHYAREMSIELDRQWQALATGATGPPTDSSPGRRDHSGAGRRDHSGAGLRARGAAENSGGRVVAACTCVESPGRTAVLFLPDARLPQIDSAAISPLLAHVIDAQSDRDLRLLQCLLRTDDDDNRAALVNRGFRDIATLIYMECNITSGGAQATTPEMAPAPAPSVGRASVPAVEWITYDQAHHAEFADLITATYRDSLDCPGLLGLRHIDDIIAGHKSAGRFRSDRWLLLRCRGRPAGCILFGANPLRPSLDLVYMGIPPDKRGQGLGRLILARGLAVARLEKVHNVTLAVDARNQPALAIYQSAGFRETARRRAMIRPLNPS